MKNYLLLFIILFNTSCTKFSKIYTDYKKFLGLEERGSYLLANNKPVFLNNDLNIEYQVFDDLSESTLNILTNKEEKKAEEFNIKEEEKAYIDEEFTKNLASFEAERLTYKDYNQRMPASLISTDTNSYIKAQNYIKKGAFTKAESELKKYLEEDADKIHAYSSYLNLAEIKIQNKKYIDALHYYKEILINNYDKTDKELILSKLYFLYLKLGKKDLALNYKKKLENSYPASSYLKNIK